LGLLTLIAVCGCRPGAVPEDSATETEAEASAARDDQLFQIAIHNLNQLEEYNGSEMLKPALDRLNRWASHQKPPPGWKPDPMLQTLPAPLRELAVVKALDTLEFRLESPPDDGWTLQEAIWLRDLSRWARGNSFDPLEQAKQLFDWTVRNIQLEPEHAVAGGTPRVAIQRPWETLLFGRGTAVDRTWVFLLLARQQRLDAAALAVGDPGNPEASQVIPGLVVLLQKGQLYLFDLALGLPIPGPKGITRDARGRLDIRPATLAEAIADDGLLRQLDGSLTPYPLKSSQLKKVTILLEASPASLSRRMKLLESRLAGADELRITADPGTQARLFRKCEHVAEVRLWQVPYMTILEELQNREARARWQATMRVPFMAEFPTSTRQRERETDDPEADSRGPRNGLMAALWKGRVYHLKGRLTGSPNAVECYQLARVSQYELRTLSTAKNKEILAKYLWAKLDASYWLGLVAAAQDNQPSAEDYFQNRTLEALPGSFWTWGAIYNLGRVYEASGQPKKAIELYRKEIQPEAPDHPGNLLRAGWLESLMAAPKPVDAKKSPSPSGRGAG
jgi:tetratricopeptide (TPR) repeat protein